MTDDINRRLIAHMLPWWVGPGPGDVPIPVPGPGDPLIQIDPSIFEKLEIKQQNIILQQSVDMRIEYLNEQIDILNKQKVLMMTHLDRQINQLERAKKVHVMALEMIKNKV